MTSRLGGVDNCRERESATKGEEGKESGDRERKRGRDNQCKYVCQKRVH